MIDIPPNTERYDVRVGGGEGLFVAVEFRQKDEDVRRSRD